MSRYYKCPKCDGKGYIVIKANYGATGIFTLGLINFLDECMKEERRCDLCKGKGYIKNVHTKD